MGTCKYMFTLFFLLHIQRICTCICVSCFPRNYSILSGACTLNPCWMYYCINIYTSMHAHMHTYWNMVYEHTCKCRLQMYIININANATYMWMCMQMQIMNVNGNAEENHECKHKIHLQVHITFMCILI